MPKETNLEIKVGGFVILAFVVLTFFLISISDVSLFEKRRPMQVSFEFANGLKKAAPVRMAGVDAGIVRGLSVYTDPEDKRLRIKVDLWIKEGMTIPNDSILTINQLGLLGEKYIEIFPGKSQEYFADNSLIKGHDPVPMEKIHERIDSITMKLDTALDGINNKVLTDKNAQSLESTMEGLSVVMTNIKEGHGTFGKFLVDEGIYNNLNELSADLKVNPWKLLYRPKGVR